MNKWLPEDGKSEPMGLDRAPEPFRFNRDIRPLYVPWSDRLRGVWWLLCEMWPTLRGLR